MYAQPPVPLTRQNIAATSELCGANPHINTLTNINAIFPLCFLYCVPQFEVIRSSVVVAPSCSVVMEIAQLSSHDLSMEHWSHDNSKWCGDCNSDDRLASDVDGHP